jgi:hypothetical protein
VACSLASLPPPVGPGRGRPWASTGAASILPPAPKSEDLLPPEQAALALAGSRHRQLGFRASSCQASCWLLVLFARFAASPPGGWISSSSSGCRHIHALVDFGDHLDQARHLLFGEKADRPRAGVALHPGAQGDGVNRRRCCRQRAVTRLTKSSDQRWRGSHPASARDRRPVRPDL